jgi:H+-transporting ATPase
MKNFITYRIAATLQLLIFFFIAVLALKPSDFHDEDDDEWPNYFKLPVLMLMLITLLNDGTLISIGYDYVTPSRYPNVWNLPVLFLIASVLGGVALISSLILLYALLDSWHDNNIFHQMGIGSLSYGQITTAMYLKVSVSDFLTLFSARTHDGFFWSSEPSPILLSAACFSLVISTLLACFWPKSVVDDQDVEGLAYNAPYLAIVVWIYCILWWFFQDLAKVGVYYVMGKYNILGINDSTMLGKEGEQRNSSVGDDDENLKTKLLG